MSTKEEPGPFDGMARAEPDEPVFTLRAHDALAPGLVHEWVRQRREVIGRADYPEEKRELELIQCREAEEIAWSMADWRNGSRPVEEAAPEKSSPNYSGNTSSVEEIAAKRRYDVTKGAVATLHNALAEITDAANNLSEFGHEGERAVILAAAERLKAVAAHIAPKRASYSTVDPEPEPFVVPDIEKTAFQHGYMIAVANLINLHGSETEAADLMSEAGWTWAEVDALDLCEYDLNALAGIRPETDADPA